MRDRNRSDERRFWFKGKEIKGGKKKKRRIQFQNSNESRPSLRITLCESVRYLPSCTREIHSQEEGERNWKRKGKKKERKKNRWEGRERGKGFRDRGVLARVFFPLCRVKCCEKMWERLARPFEDPLLGVRGAFALDVNSETVRTREHTGQDTEHQAVDTRSKRETEVGRNDGVETIGARWMREFPYANREEA